MSSTNLYVGNLSFTTTESALEAMFSEFGRVESAKIIMDRYSGQSRGFGFVEMASRGEAEQAIAALNGKELDSRRLKVNEAKPRNNDNRGGGSRGGGGWR
ncbi:MAG: RNA-binding protein [Thermodesulfobacteriota bacterium]